MVARARKIDYRLLTGPKMAGIQAEIQADANMNRSIMGGMVGLGQGIGQAGRNKESERRYEKDYELRKGALDLRTREYEHKIAKEERLRVEQQNSWAAIYGEGQAMAASGDPRATEAVQDLVGRAGGPEAVKGAMNRVTIKPNVPLPEQIKCGPSG